MTRKQKKIVREPVQQRGKDKKAKIIAVARKLLNRKDFEAVTASRIAQEAGVSVGTFYSYFKDKRDVFLDVIRQYSEDIYRELAASIRNVKKGPSNLEEVVRSLILVAKNRHDHEKGLHKQMLVQSIRDPEIRKLSMMEEGRADFLIREIIEQYKDQIDVKDADAAVFLVTNCVEEMIHHLLIHGSEIPEERVFDELACMVYRFRCGHPVVSASSPFAASMPGSRRAWEILPATLPAALRIIRKPSVARTLITLLTCPPQTAGTGRRPVRSPGCRCQSATYRPSPAGQRAASQVPDRRR